MGYQTKITSKGQITLPAGLREELDVAPGDKVYFLKGLDDEYRILVRKAKRWDLEPLFEWDGPPVPIAAMDPGNPDFDDVSS